MKLGLIGTGKQGQRYLMEKNGGRHIVRSSSRSIDYEGLDGVIIATHPAGHKKLALECIERRIPFLCEKPLALTLQDCLEVIDASQHRGVPMHVAHLDCWAAAHLNEPDTEAYAVISYREHKRDYSPWLDWAPHALALLDRKSACYPGNVSLYQDARNRLQVFTRYGACVYTRRDEDGATPMWLAVRDIKKNGDWDSYRRIYRALFSE